MWKWLYDRRYINCLFYAMLQRWLHGGHVEVRRSKKFKHLYHFVWRKPNGSIQHWIPTKSHGGLRGFFHAWWFKGVISTVDDYPRW